MWILYNNFRRCWTPSENLAKWQHCQQLGDFLRVAGGVGSDAAAEAVDGRAEPVQLYDIKVMSGP